MSKVCLGKSQRKSITKDEGYGEAHRQNTLSPVSGGGEEAGHVQLPVGNES